MLTSPAAHQPPGTPPGAPAPRSLRRRKRRTVITPEMQRALRLSPRLPKRHRERQAALLDDLETGNPDSVLDAARSWAESERAAAAADVAEKTTDLPKHRVSFLVEESEFRDFCETAAESDLSPSEVARRYCVSGHRFSTLIWETVRRVGTVEDWVNISRPGPNLAEMALPNFMKSSPKGLS